MSNTAQSAESIPAGLLSLAMAFVPTQEFDTPYDPVLAFSRGTIDPHAVYEDRITHTLCTSYIERLPFRLEWEPFVYYIVCANTQGFRLRGK